MLCSLIRAAHTLTVLGAGVAVGGWRKPAARANGVDTDDLPGVTHTTPAKSTAELTRLRSCGSNLTSPRLCALDVLKTIQVKYRALAPVRSAMPSDSPRAPSC